MVDVAGKLVTEILPFDGERAVTAYVPPAPVDSVVFAADGGWHTTRLGDALERAGVTMTMIVGVHGQPDDDGRLAEYVLGRDAHRFAAHERFFVDDVPAWVRARFGLDLSAARTAAWGASLGAEFALAMGLRHPDVYRTVLGASPGAGYPPPAPLPPSPPRVHLVAGHQEPFFLTNAMRWRDALSDAGGDVVLGLHDGGHGDPFWYGAFPAMVAWAFPC